MSQDRFSNPKYVDWLKEKLCLQYAKDGLEPITERQVQTFHTNLSSRLQAPSSSSVTAVPLCHSCLKTDLKRQWNRQRFSCLGGICNGWLGLLHHDHVNPTSTVEWDNFDVSQLPVSAWECAKVYLPYGSGKVQCAGDADLAAILTLYLNCRHFASGLHDVTLCEKVKEIRNRLLHSGTMELEHSQMLSDVGVIKQLLNDPAFAADTSCQEAITKIDQLVTDKLELSQNKELELFVLNSDIKSVTDKTDQLKHTMDNLTGQVQQQYGQLRTEVSEVTTEVSSLKDQLRTEVSGVTTEVSSLKDRLQTQVIGMTTEVSSLKDRLQTQVSGMTTEVSSLKDRLRTEVSEMTIEVSSLKEKINISTEDIVELHKVADLLCSFINACQIDKADMGQLAVSISTLSTLRSEAGRQAEILDQLYETVGRHDVKLEQHGGTLEQHGRTLEQHGGTLQQHKRRLSDIESELKSKKGCTDGNNVKTADLADLRTTLLDLYKDRLQCIPIYLIKPDWKHPVKDLYVKQNLKRVDPRGKPEHPVNPHMPQAGNHDKNKPTNDDDKNIDKVTDILFKDGKVCKDVYVTSEAGYGKTTLCAHLVRLWCDAHSKLDVDSASIDPDLANDLRSMKKFKLLFYIDLSDADISKEAPKSDEISLLIHSQHELSDQCYTIADIKRCLSDASTLVLMDSLDELRAPRLPYRGLHNKSCIVTTSRPWKLEALRSQLQQRTGYQHVEIVGLTETSPTDLVTGILKILNKECEQEKNVRDFFYAIYSANLEDFLAIPVLILQMLGLWFDGESFGSSQSEIYSNVVHHQILTAIKNKKLPKYDGRSERPFPLPCSSESQCPCKAYGELLWKVASMAFHTLFGESREMCLVFDHETTSFYGLSDEEVEICLKMGILTQHKLFVKKISAEKKSVSFLHKTNQENFSALFLSCKWSEYVKNQIFSFIKDLDRAMELDKVLLFCSQLNQDVARELSSLISVRADDDQRVQEYRQSGEYDAAPNKDLIYKIQNIVSAAVQQSIKISISPLNAPISSSQQAVEAPTPFTQNRSGSTPKLVMADIILGEPQWRRTIVIDDSRLVEALDMAELKSVRINAESADVTIWKLLEQETRSLQSLVVWTGEKTNVKNIHGVVVRNLATLRTLGLQGGIYGGWPPLDLSGLGNKVSVMLTCDLTCLLLHNIELSHKQCVMLVQRLSEKQNLQRLTLSQMTFSHEQCVMLVQRLSEKQNLQRLTLDDITCQTHGEDSGECCDVKLQSRLEHVKLKWLPFRDVSFHTVDLKTCEIGLWGNVPAATSALSCLTSASNLREFTCWYLCDVASVQLVAVLPRLHGLQRIVLDDIDFGSEREIRLSAAAKTLESLVLVDSTITADGLESLVESVKAPRVMIELYNVTIRDRDPRDFLQRLRESPDYEVTWDEDVEYQESDDDDDDDDDVEYQESEGGWRVGGWFVFYKNK